jgi:signal transduction histidine kinase
MQQPKGSLSAKRVFNQIGSRYALSNQTLILFAWPAFASALILDHLRLGGSLEPKIYLALAGYLAPVAVLMLFRIFLPDEPRNNNLVLVFVAFLTAGFARGVVVYNLGLSLELFDQSELVYRLVGGPSFTFVMLSVCTILVSNYRRYRDTLENLSSERFRLEIMAANISGQIELQREELLSKVKALLTPAIRRVQNNLSGMRDKKGLEQAVISIKSTVDEVVRPLSQQVSESIAQDAFPGQENPYREKEKAPIPKRVFISDFLFPLWGSILTSLSAAPAAYVVEEWAQATLMLILVFATMLGYLSLLSFLSQNFSVPPVLAGAVVIIGYSISVLPLAFYRQLLNWDISMEVVYSLIAFAMFLGTTFFFGELTQIRRRATAERLAQVNAQLEMLNASLRQEVWLNRRRTAAVLHGPVQAALYVSAMKLAQSQEPTPELLESVEKDIANAIEMLNDPSNLNREGVIEVLGQIADLWSDTSKISLEIDKDLAMKIDEQPLAKESVIEVAREFVNNAIKHGKAKNVKLKIDLLDPYRLSVVTINDGSTVTPNKQPGYGSKILSELTMDWSIETVEDTTVSKAEIVMARDNL